MPITPSRSKVSNIDPPPPARITNTGVSAARTRGRASDVVTAQTVQLGTSLAGQGPSTHRLPSRARGCGQDDRVDTVVAALVGAIVGSIGAQIIGELLRRRRSRSDQYRQAVNRYLLQLQDAAESVHARITNLADDDGMAVMTDEYYLTSTLYAVGCLLAQKRRLLLDGIYALLEESHRGLGSALERELESIEGVLGRADAFQRYERLLLAEAVLAPAASGWQTTTYTDFVTKWASTGGTFRQQLAAAEEFARSAQIQPPRLLIPHLAALGTLLATHTHLTYGPGARPEPGASVR